MAHHCAIAIAAHIMTNDATMPAIQALRARGDIPFRRLTAAGCFVSLELPSEREAWRREG